MQFSGPSVVLPELMLRLALPAAAIVLLTIPGAFAQVARSTVGGELTSEEEI